MLCALSVLVTARHTPGVCNIYRYDSLEVIKIGANINQKWYCNTIWVRKIKMWTIQIWH